MSEAVRNVYQLIMTLSILWTLHALTQSSSSDDDSDSSDDDEPRRRSHATATTTVASSSSSGVVHHRDGTVASASAVELKIAAQLAKDPWGRCVLKVSDVLSHKGLKHGVLRCICARSRPAD